MKNSMPERPRSDRELDATIALRTLTEEFPKLQFHEVSFFGSGWATDVYLVDDRLVARFPRNRELAQWLDRDEAILRFVASHLASAFAVPKVVRRGKAGAHFPHDFLVCELVPGIGADHPEAPHSDRLISDLGEALTHIHGVPVASAADIGLTQPEHDDYKGAPRFVHGDFSPDNVIVDPTSGRLVGVIDWGNSAIGDPALDFIWLVLWRGWSFALAVLDAYELPVEEDFIDRVRFHARVRALEWLTDTIKRRADPELHLSWLRNAFSL